MTALTVPWVTQLLPALAYLRVCQRRRLPWWEALAVGSVLLVGLATFGLCMAAAVGKVTQHHHPSTGEEERGREIAIWGADRRPRLTTDYWLTGSRRDSCCCCRPPPVIIILLLLLTVWRWVWVGGRLVSGGHQGAAWPHGDRVRPLDHLLGR